MAVSIVMTGTARSCNITSGSSSMVVSSATGLVVGATIQGTGIPTGSRIGTISGTTVTMVTASGLPSNATVTNATASLIFSSVFGSVLTVSLSASGDYATPQNIYNAGFGVMSDNLALRQLFFPGGLFVRWSNIVSGAVFDFLNWDLEFGVNGRFAFQESSIVGELRGGYLVNGTQFIKTVGPTFYTNNFNGNQAGGTSIFENVSGTTNQGLFRMHNLRVVELAGSNAAPAFTTARMTMDVENMILDYQGDSAGANAGVGAAFGTLKNTYLVKVNGGIGATNGTNFATWDGLIYTGNYQAAPQHKFSTSQGYVLDGYSPQVLSNQFLGGFNSVTLETYSNINLSTAGWGLNDLKTRYQRYFGPITLQFPRRVSFQFNDSVGVDLTNVTLYIRSGATSVINAVQAGDYSANTQALNLIWSSSVAQYRLCDTFIDTIAQVAQVRKYGFIQQSTSYDLNLAAYSQPFFMLADASLSGITESTASAITNVNISWGNKVVTVTANGTYDQINARIAWELAQTANSAQTDPRTINGKNLNLASGWSVIVMPGVTLTGGTNITYIYSDTFRALTLADAPYLFNSGGVLQSDGLLLSTTVLGVLDTYTGTGSITAIYQDNTGTSTNLQISGFDSGSAVYVEDNNFVKKFYSANASGEVIVYIPPTATGSWYYAVEKYGNQRQSDFFTFSGGQKAIVVKAIPDTGLTVLNSATVGAYTSLENPDKIYDYVAFLRLSEPHISYGQIVFKDGKSLDLQNASMLVNQSASAVASFNYDTKLLTIKSLVLNTGVTFDKIIAIPPATITANTNEQINVLIEDANGDSSLTLLGGDNLGYKLWKVPSSSPVDVDPTTGVLLTTLANNTSAFRFIGISGFDIIGIDLSSGVKRRTSMLKGVYNQSFYVGDQIQLSTDAPQLIENNQKLDELILKVDTNLDVAVSTRATDEQVWDYTTRTLTSAGAAGATLAEIEASTILAKEATSQSIKTKVDSLNNYNDVALVAKVDAIKTVADSIKTTVEDKTGYSLTESQINLIAYTVESHLLNEGDSQQLVNAIVGAIGNTNIDETVLVAAIRADLERAGGKIDSTAVKVDGLANYDDTTLQAKVDAVKTKVDKSLTKTQFLSFD